MQKLLLLHFCYSLLFFSCQKEKLPKPTQEGKNTFGCKINGKNWVPSGGGGFSGIKPVDGGFFENINTIYIRAYSKDESVQLYLRDVFNIGEYSLSSNTIPMPDNLDPKSYGLYSVRKDNATSTYITNTMHAGKVIISNRDTVNKIISGTFEFTAVNSNGKTVKITDGRFDVKKQ